MMPYDSQKAGVNTGVVAKDNSGTYRNKITYIYKGWILTLNGLPKKGWVGVNHAVRIRFLNSPPMDKWYLWTKYDHDELMNAWKNK